MTNDEKYARLVLQAKHLLKFSYMLTSIAVLIMLFMYRPGLFEFEEELVPMSNLPTDVDRDLIEDGIHVRTGLIDAEGMFLVVNNCTNCHSAKIVTQNSMTTERWNETITWMQETQNLWDLGENQEVIVNYLVTNYPLINAGGRRANLTDIHWYEMED